MTIYEIKEAALAFKTQNKQELSNKIKELKENNVSFLGCVAFLQHSQQVSLYDARKQMLELDIWTQEEKDAISESHLIMMSDFRNDESEE